MTSSRSYRPALTVEGALEELERNAGTQFDPFVVARLVELIRSGAMRVGEDRQPHERPL